MADGQLAMNTAASSPGLFYKDAGGALVKVGPVHVGTSAPNASPASGGTAGNSVGEQWLDTSGSTYVFKIWDGSAWRSEAGEFVNATGDVMTGALGIIAGSAAAPGLYFSGDTNTGIYSPGADQVAISTNGTGRLFVDASGRLSVGASSTDRTAEFYTASGNNGLRISNGADGAADFAVLDLIQGASQKFVLYTNQNNSIANANTGAFIFQTGATERMRLDSSGRLGLGTSSPAARLEISNSLAGTSEQIRLTNTNTTGVVGSSIFFKGFYNTALISSEGQPGASTGGTLRLQTYSDDSTLNTGIYINRLGNVGIGVASPAGILDLVTGTNRVYFDDSAGNLCRLNAVNAANSAYAPLSLNGSVLTFQTGATERARIDSSGRLLVGTSTGFGNSVFTKAEFVNSASYANIVVGRTDGASGSGSTIGTISFLSNAGGAGEYHASIAAEMDAASGSGDKPGRLVFSTCPDGSATPVERCRLNSSGSLIVGGGSSDRDGWLCVEASGEVKNVLVLSDTRSGAVGAHSIARFRRDGAEVGSITTTSTSTAYNTSSDYRLKENIVPLTGAAARVQQLKPSQFNFIADPGKTVDGFIAHEAQAVVPECVTGTKDEVDADGNPIYQGIDQSKLVPLLTAALQEAIAEIESLKARVTALEP
jgi:hypothetical protein